MIDFDKIIFRRRCGEVSASAPDLHAFSRPESLWQGCEVFKTTSCHKTTATGLD
jgi:hypothetical protein